jgi:hypothetical protein
MAISRKVLGNLVRQRRDVEAEIGQGGQLVALWASAAHKRRMTLWSDWQNCDRTSAKIG